MSGLAQRGQDDVDVVVAIVVNYEAGDLLAAAVASLRDQVAHVIVADNGSTDGSTVGLERPGTVHVFATGANLGYGAGANLGASEALARSATAVLVCNPDLVIAPGCVAAMARRLRTEVDLGIVGPRLRNTDGSIYQSGRPFPSMRDALGHAFVGLVWPANPWSMRYLRHDWERDETTDVDWISGACMLVRRSLWDQLGGFDEGFFMFMEDVDLCWRAGAAGFRVSIEPAAEVVHVIGASRRKHPVRMVVAHHRSMWRWSRLRFAGWRRWVLPLVAVALVVRAGLVIAATRLGMLAGRPEARA